MALRSGSRLGPYEIVGPLGTGGMGEVYRALDRKLDCRVAIKVLPESVAEEPGRLARFDREARAVAALSLSNILAIHDFGTDNGVAYAVTEFLESEILRGRLAAGPIPQRQAATASPARTPTSSRSRTSPSSREPADAAPAMSSEPR